jgi:hypothetical protein
MLTNRLRYCIISLCNDCHKNLDENGDGTVLICSHVKWNMHVDIVKSTTKMEQTKMLKRC